jgi:hypothetical protein
MLPGTGRWQREALTEGIFRPAPRVRRIPSTILRMVPLPVPGRNSRETHPRPGVMRLQKQLQRIAE